MADRRQLQPQGGARRLEVLRQKRNMLRTRSEEGSSWAGGQHAGLGRQGSDGAAAAAAAHRRRAAAYALSSSSSSSSSDAEDAGAEGRGGGPAPSEQEITAKLFAKLGIKQPGGGRGAAGFDSDSSWASSPERSRLIKAGGGGASSGVSGCDTASSGVGVAGDAAAAAELAKARGTIAALQEELAAARAQADGTMQQLRAAQAYAQEVEAQLYATEQELAALRGGQAGTPAQEAQGWGQTGLAAPTADQAAYQQEDAAQLAAANCELQRQVEELGAQLAAAATWQHEVHGMRAELAGMQAAVAESEAARQQAEAELGALLQQREGQLMSATARLAATEAQLAALQGDELGLCADASGGPVALRPATELLAAFTVTHAQISAALAEAAQLLQ